MSGLNKKQLQQASEEFTQVLSGFTKLDLEAWLSTERQTELKEAYDKYVASASQYTEPKTFDAWFHDVANLRHSC